MRYVVLFYFIKCVHIDPSGTDVNVGATSHFQGRLCSHPPSFGALERVREAVLGVAAKKSFGGERQNVK